MQFCSAIVVWRAIVMMKRLRTEPFGVSFFVFYLNKRKLPVSINAFSYRGLMENLSINCSKNGILMEENSKDF